MEKKPGLTTLTCILACLLPLLVFSQVRAQATSQDSAAQQSALELMQRLSPEEKVGQLFLITFDGQETGEYAPVADLIANYHVGGVVLRRANDNFQDTENVITSTYRLIADLQGIEWEARNSLISLGEGGVFNDFIPLFVGISQTGDSYPNDQILRGLSPISSQMALGATWDVSLAEKSGTILGQELAALGFNLYLGPSLDVLDITYNESGDDLGVRTFGGDPYWVAEMGKAAIRGLHAGSGARLTVIARNFPGRGSSDRLPEEEVATVRKSLEQLKLIELAPFFQVTDLSNTAPEEIADGLLLSHIRYQGFQGNIRATTKPVSFDQTAVDLLMNLTQLNPWRKAGGLLVSEDLGSDAVKKFFNPSGQTFDARQVARNAFLAGNDMLFMDQLISTGDQDRYETYKKTLELFVQKVREDPAFAAKVDESVLRILTRKFTTYPEFDLTQVTPSEFRLADIGMQNQMAFEIASKAATLISPEAEQLGSSLPDEPLLGERIVIFTDVSTAQQCSLCQPHNIVAVDSLQKAIVNLYGPKGSGQVSENQLISYSFQDLQDYIDNPFNRVELETNLSRANWVLFVVQDNDTARPGSRALQNLLAEKTSAFRNKNVVVFSFNAPYYFDATDISAFTAYYGLYSKLPGFVEVAARLLFQEMAPLGSSPVSIPGVAYNLITATTPRADQVIELMVDDEAPTLDESAGDEALPPGQRIYNLGDNLPVKTGVIIDHNGHPVPDGTVARFTLNQQGESITIQQIESVTSDGIARASIKLQSAGIHELRVSSEPALNSQILLLNISAEEGTLISAITPTPMPTQQDSSTPEANESVAEETPPRSTPDENNKFLEWLLGSLLAWGSGLVFFNNSEYPQKIRHRAMVSAGITTGGLLASFWLMMGWPGSRARFGFSGLLTLGLWIATGAIIAGLALYWFTKKSEKDQVSKAASNPKDVSNTEK